MSFTDDGHYEPTWTDETAALYAYWEHIFGPVPCADAGRQPPTPEQQRAEPMVGIVYRLAQLGKTFEMDSEEARRQLARLFVDSETAIEAHNRAFAVEVLAS